MYLAKVQEQIDIEHICCWAHVWHKFKLAYVHGRDERARIFLMLIGDLMLKAENNLQSFWKQLMAWRNDRNYSIDNNLAERSIYPLTIQRKNSMLFGSEKGVLTSTIYHTIIENSKLACKSPSRFMERFFHELNTGRTDYQNLLPMTIGGI